MTWPGGIIKENVQEAHAIDSVRTFEVYNEGQLIADYTGKFSIQQNEDRVIVIDCDTGDSFTLYGDVSVIIKTVFQFKGEKMLNDLEKMFPTKETIVVHLTEDFSEKELLLVYLEMMEREMLYLRDMVKDLKHIIAESQIR